MTVEQEMALDEMPDSMWQLKPWWCQPWSIILTGIAIPARILAVAASPVDYAAGSWRYGSMVAAIFGVWCRVSILRCLKQMNRTANVHQPLSPSSGL